MHRLAKIIVDIFREQISRMLYETFNRCRMKLEDHVWKNIENMEINTSIFYRSRKYYKLQYV